MARTLLFLLSGIHTALAIPLGGGDGFDGGEEDEGEEGGGTSNYESGVGANAGEGGSGGGSDKGAGIVLVWIVLGTLGFFMLCTLIWWTCRCAARRAEKKRERNVARPVVAVVQDRNATKRPQEEPSARFGKKGDAFPEDCRRGKKFCKENPLVGSMQNSIVDSSKTFWCAPTGFEQMINFSGDTAKTIVRSEVNTPICTIHTTLPLAKNGSQPVEYSVRIMQLPPGSIIAVGLGCLPYPVQFRMPGWHRESAAVHSDDGSKFYADSYGGKSYTDPFIAGDMIRLSFSGENGVLAYYKNDVCLGAAFTGIFSHDYPVYGMIGVLGAVELEISYADAEDSFMTCSGEELEQAE